MEPIDLDSIYNLYSVANKTFHPQLIGRVVVTPTEMSVLADYNGCLENLDGPVTPKRLKALAGWVHGSHSFGATLQEIKEGKFPQVLPEQKVEDVEDEAPSTSDEKWFKVLRDDLPGPMMVKFHQGKAYLADSDQPMDPSELNRILDLANTGKAVIRHHKPVEQMVGLMKSLSKSEEDEPKDDGMSDHLFQDPMLPGIGNAKAYKNSPTKNGVYVMLDANDTGSINKIHGHRVGDMALRSYGEALRGSLDEVAGKEHQDVWRMVGDQFMVNLPSHEHAARFLRTLRGKLEAVVPVGGTHKLSMNAGIGTHPMSARMAVMEANRAKREGNHLPGTSPGYAHSLVPGSEGPVAVQPEIPEKP